MKNIINKAIAILVISIALTACSNSNNDEVTTGTGKLVMEFDNAYVTNDLILNTQANTTSNNEVLKISKVKYIISNIVLTKVDGTTITYPKNKSYFIVDEATEESLEIELENIPAGDYSAIKFGIGVDKAHWDLGEAAQGDFMAKAKAEGMLSSYSEGYIFLAFDGVFTSPTITTAIPFMVQTGPSGANYNYTEITLNLPSNALVRSTITPEVHIIADVSKIIDGTNKIKLSDNTMGSMAMITSGANLPLITANLSAMFTVAHVHND